MPRISEKSYEDRLTEAVSDHIELTSDVMALEKGPPPDMNAPSEREKVRLWGRTDPAVNYDQLVNMLTTTGVPPELMAQMQIGRYGKSHPELVQAFAQPTEDRGLAERLAALAEYPFKIALFDQYDPKDRVTEAERLDREWQKTQASTMGDDDDDFDSAY